MPDNIEIRHIRTDGGTQPRAGINHEVVADYANSVKEGELFPAIIVFHDGANYWLADGFHRVAAHKLAQKQRILAEIRQGTLRDAILYSVGANATHGLQRSRDDKRRAVETLLNDPEWGQWSDRQIAKRCNVSNTYVGNIRQELGLVTVNVDSDGRKYITKHGTEATMLLPLKQRIKQLLEQRYQTTEPAKLAMYARAIHNGGGGEIGSLCDELGRQSTPMVIADIRHSLIELANEWQSFVPEKPKDDHQIPALLVFVDAVKSLDWPDVSRINELNQFEISRIKRHPNAKDMKKLDHYHKSLEALLCALRPN